MRPNHLLAIALAAASLAFAGPVPAEPVIAKEAATHLAPGTKVKLTFPDERGVEGTLLALDDQQFTVQVGDGTRVYGRRYVGTLSVSRGSYSRGRGAAIGIGVGALMGTVVGLASRDDSPKRFFMRSGAGDQAVILGLGLGIVGVVIGALASPGERWEEVPVGGAHLGPGLVPGGAVGASVALRF